MKYRKYKSAILVVGMFIVAQGFIACASSTSGRNPDSLEDQEQKAPTHRYSYDGREPSSTNDKFTWIDDVGDNFGRIAADTSNRAVASENKKEVLLAKKNWSFSYLPKTNTFYEGLQGETYPMLQPSIGGGDTYAFAAQGQAENPVTLSIAKDTGRVVASGVQCEAELSYWNVKTHNYAKDTIKLHGEACERVISRLKDYVP